jgi:hypothetical protein
VRRDLGAKPNEISWAVSVGRPQTGGPKAQSSSTSFRRKTSLYFMLEPHCLQCRTYITVTTFQCCLVAAQSQAQRPTRYCRKLSQQTSTTPNFIPEIVFTCKATQVPTHKILTERAQLATPTSSSARTRRTTKPSAISHRQNDGRLVVFLSQYGLG